MFKIYNLSKWSVNKEGMIVKMQNLDETLHLIANYNAKLKILGDSL